MHEFRTRDTGRRCREYQVEDGRTYYEVAPLGDDGEGDWPQGAYWCANGSERDSRKWRWYAACHIAKGVVAWERCAPPKRYPGEEWPRQETGTLILETFSELTQEDCDTIPCAAPWA